MATPFGRDGRSHEAMQRAIARVEHDHGFKCEPGARYEIRDGEVQRLPLAPKPAKVRAPITTATRQWEAETGIESFTRYAQEMLAPLIDAADTWDDVQSALAPLGARIMKAGSGGKIESADGHHKVKLANIDRSLTWGKLIKRWGEWSEPAIDAVPYEPRILDPEQALRWARRDEQAEEFHAAVQARIDRLKIECKSVVDTAQREHRQRRADLAALHGDPQDLARLRQSMDVLQRHRIARLRQEYGDRITALRELRGEIADAERLDDIALDDIAAFERGLSIDWACRPAQLVKPPGFIAEVVGQSVHYWRDDGHARRPAFAERGDRIWINDDSDIAIRAALIVAQARYGVVAARGDADFVAKAQRLGRELGIEVQDGTVDAAPPTRARSPRIRQRRDAAHRWQATADARQHEPMPAARDRRARGDVAHGPARQSSAVAGDRRDPAMSDAARQAILVRVHRLLADDDWDPRDYYRAATGRGQRGSQQAQDASDRSSRYRPSAASRQAQIDSAGRGG